MSTYYYVESKDDKGAVQVVGHSQDEETKEIYYKFIDKSKAKKLLQDEKIVSPEYKYRLVKITQNIKFENWE